MVKKPKPHPAEAAMARAIKKAKKEDPLIGIKIGSKEFLNFLVNAIGDDNGVHAETLLAILGSLGGFSCQMSVRAMNPNPDFFVVDDAEGRHYFFGDAINAPLAENQYCFCNIAGGGAQAAGATSFPDIDEMFDHVAKSVGEPDFGIPRVPETHRPSDLPVNYISAFWPAMPDILAQYCDTPDQWPFFFGLVTQHAILLTEDALDPSLAFKLVMECAIPMSKINPADYLPK